MVDDGPQLEAHGVSSAVDDGNHEHILMLDWDDYDPEGPLDKLRENAEGITALLESSEGSWHAVNFTVKPIDDVALELMEYKSDPMRTMMGYTWNPPRWVTRLGPKSDADGEEVKPSPTLKGLQYEPTHKEQSLGHFNLFGAFIDGWPDEGPGGVNWRECAPTVEKYRTFTEGNK